MLTGINSIQFFPSLKLTSRMNGSHLQIGNKIILHGNVENFLHEEQKLHKIQNSITDTSNSNSNSSLVNDTVINAIINPFKYYFNPIEQILTHSKIDHGLENLFPLKSIGNSSQDDTITSFDQDMIR